ncbi:MAG: hypothetical protein M0R68_13850 [Bacteroidetes bacterium]|nr:hypothetical protein [Bacteroidota bacterium]
MKFDITLLTAEHYLHPERPDWYVQQILQEDQLVRDALERKGLRVHRIDWTNKAFVWSDTTALLFRAVWDYTNRYDEFIAFLHMAAERAQLINPVKTILWNLDKHYLRDLHSRGISIPETIYIERYSSAPLREVYNHSGFAEAILKPAMSAGARHTYRLTKLTISEYEGVFRELIAQEAMMLQPFLHSVLSHGEISLVIIGGKYTHAIQKRVTQGDFRVQDDFGGSVHAYEPTPEEITLAEQTVNACTPLPAYARVDLLRDDTNTPVVSELEAIEPELWFRFFPTAADRLAEVINDIL